MRKIDLCRLRLKPQLIYYLESISGGRLTCCGGSPSSSGSSHNSSSSSSSDSDPAGFFMISLVVAMALILYFDSAFPGFAFLALFLSLLWAVAEDKSYKAFFVIFLLFGLSTLWWLVSSGRL